MFPAPARAPNRPRHHLCFSLTFFSFIPINPANISSARLPDARAPFPRRGDLPIALLETIGGLETAAHG
jgi:hypothetical protein